MNDDWRREVVSIATQGAQDTNEFMNEVMSVIPESLGEPYKTRHGKNGTTLLWRKENEGDRHRMSINADPDGVIRSSYYWDKGSRTECFYEGMERFTGELGKLCTLCIEQMEKVMNDDKEDYTR